MKTCISCAEAKPLEDFYRHPETIDGRLGRCKACHKKGVREACLRDPGRRRAYDGARQKTPERRVAKLGYQRKSRLEHPEKHRARALVAHAVKAGRLVRQPCGACGSPKAEAHHHDYSKPLDVKWLCFRCHRELEHGQHPA